MDIPIEFPDEKKRVYDEAVAFRRLSPSDRVLAILELISLGASMMKESPHKEAIARLQETHEEAWQQAQKELFARHGI